ncbi:EpsG family protein [Corynebacterium glutamicum]|uniref:EpsG family protein n=1 Tax=Corynebacterium glutamicum TaxID=1718 RepID=UPI000744AF3C|nr:EpsG family protein [Corynebacterium glutamicum]ALZ99139.1 hypothetical protein APT58_02230 [Corynebacterium glutamicum]
MTIYFINLALLGYFWTLSQIRQKAQTSRRKLQGIFSILMGFVLIIVLARRNSSVGVDVSLYLYYWNLAESHSLEEITRFEPSFNILTEFSRQISDSPHFFLCVVALLSIAPISWVIYKDSAQPLTSWLIYICLGFYAFTFSGLRQAIAYGFTVLSLHFIRKKQPLIFVALVILAWSFHSSALLFLPAYWVYWYRVNRTGIILYLISLPVVFALRIPIFAWFTTNFYTEYDISTSSSFTWLSISSGIVLFGWALLKSSEQEKPPSTDTNELAGLLQIATIGITFMLFASVGTNVMRVADYYYIFIIFAIPKAFSLYKESYHAFIKIYFVAGLIVIYVLRMLDSPYGTVPYIPF